MLSYGSIPILSYFNKKSRFSRIIYRILKNLFIKMKKYKPEYAVKVSSKNFGFENNIKSIPLYVIFCI